MWGWSLVLEKCGTRAKVEGGEDSKSPRGHQVIQKVYYKDKYIQ